MCAHQTPRGRNDSLAKRRKRSDGSVVHACSCVIAASRSAASAGRTASQAHSRTPKCASSASGRMRARRCASDRSGAAPIMKQAQPRAVSDACAAIRVKPAGPSPSCRMRAATAMRLEMPSAAAARIAAMPSAPTSGASACISKAKSTARHSVRCAAGAPAFSCARRPAPMSLTPRRAAVTVSLPPGRHVRCRCRATPSPAGRRAGAARPATRCRTARRSTVHVP